jgi:DNA-binding XRE family transcriptional regulator
MSGPGRPSDYDTSFCEQVIGLGAQGMGRAEIAAEIGVARQTLTNWSERHPEFLAALQLAHDQSLAWWEKQARTNLATAGFQASLWSRAVSGRFPHEPYRDRAEISGPEGGPLKVTRVELIGPDEA